jgi:hypothetical protein
MTDISRLKKRMSVIAADGRRIGFVSRMAWPDKIRLTCLSAGNGYDHLVPLSWVGHIDRYVYLNRSSAYVAAHWENVASAPRRAAAATMPGISAETVGAESPAKLRSAAA